MAVPETLVLGCNTHRPVLWVSCMTARGNEEAGESVKVQCAARHCKVLPWVLCGKPQKCGKLKTKTLE